MAARLQTVGGSTDVKLRGLRLANAEEVVGPSSNQNARYSASRAGAVTQALHVFHVVSGGGHRHPSKTEVSYDMLCVLRP